MLRVLGCKAIFWEINSFLSSSGLKLVFLPQIFHDTFYQCSEPYVTEDELKLMLRGAELSGAIEEEEQVTVSWNYILILLVESAQICSTLTFVLSGMFCFDSLTA